MALSSREGRIRKSANLRQEVHLEEAGMELNDVPIGRGEGLNVDGMSLRRIDVEVDGHLQAIGDA